MPCPTFLSLFDAFYNLISLELGLNLMLQELTKRDDSSLLAVRASSGHL